MNYLSQSGNHFVTESGGIGYHRTQDGHGGKAEQHRAEMEAIAEQIAMKKISEMIPQIQKDVYKLAVNDLMNALYMDVTTAVSIAFSNGETIFRDSKTQRIVADAVMREIRKCLAKRNF